MGHLLQTSNPEAAARINGEGRPLPGIAETVLYHPRAGEVRQGRKTVPAVVLSVDESNRQLELLIIHAADDMITQNRVPEHVEGDRGWSRLRSGGIAEVDQLRELVEAQQARIDHLVGLIVGDFEVPKDSSIMSMIDSLDSRVGDVEDSALKSAQQAIEPSEAKTKPGRVSRRRRGA